MENIIQDSLLYGLITMIIGSIVIRIINWISKDNESIILPTYLKSIEIPFFIIGIIIHLIMEYSGFNGWYCSKECIGDVCEMVCRKKI